MATSEVKCNPAILGKGPRLKIVKNMWRFVKFGVRNSGKLNTVYILFMFYLWKLPSYLSVFTKMFFFVWHL